MKNRNRLLLLFAGTAALMVFAVCTGPTPLLDFPSLVELMRNGPATPQLQKAALVLWELRLPRVLLAAAAGANLALGGLLLQAVFRNPLAEPYLLGISSGGALGAVLALAAGATATVWPALAGSLVVAGLVLGLCRRRIASDLPSLLLAGVALGALAQAFTTAIIIRFDPGAMRSIIFWLMGSFAGRGWSEVWLLAPAAIAATVAVCIMHRPLDLIAVGGESAHHLGVRVRLVQTAAIALAAILAALTVAACGTIGFVGLMAPHVARRLAGTPHAFSAPASAVVGVAFAVASDLAARTILAGTELPVGVVTGALGCVFFLVLLTRKN
ncbi:MAG: iron ABC transporter permease [Chthoniobacterales bacterium]|nr:iron ABC transporter permease [Chthoniobacterales bacterium]